MPTYYPKQQVGVADGTTAPAGRADGREVNAKRRSILASKVPGTAWAANDLFYLGKKPQGYKLTRVSLTTDTSLGTTTVDVGTLTAPTSYVAAKTLTVTDTPTVLGPKASTLDDDAGDAEDLYARILVAGVGSAVLLTFDLEFTGL